MAHNTPPVPTPIPTESREAALLKMRDLLKDAKATIDKQNETLELQKLEIEDHLKTIAERDQRIAELEARIKVLEDKPTPAELEAIEEVAALFDLRVG